MENTKTTITLNDKEYLIANMNEEEKMILNHIADLERKLSSAKFNVDQLQVGHNAFVSMLASSLERPKEE